MRIRFPEDQGQVKDQDQLSPDSPPAGSSIPPLGLGPALGPGLSDQFFDSAVGRRLAADS